MERSYEALHCRLSLLLGVRREQELSGRRLPYLGRRQELLHSDKVGIVEDSMENSEVIVPILNSPDGNGGTWGMISTIRSAIGTASVAWDEEGVFQSELAIKISEQLMANVEAYAHQHALENRDTYNEETLKKVFDAMTGPGGLGTSTATSAINAMQNAGILFREKEA